MTDSEKFEQSLVNELAREVLREQRRNRRWGIFFKGLLALYLLSFLLIFLAGQSEVGGFSGEKHTALIEIDGVIATNTEARADYIVGSLRKAFEDENTQGVILRINSPGGSPVQSAYINDEIKRLRKLHPDTPLYAVITDICASGGYYIAAGADKIYANKASIVGSIGVIMSGFGFVDAIEKLGIERRVLHAGKSKGFMDPFKPLKQDEEKHVQRLLDGIHQQFIEVVKEGRGDKLVNEDILFSGLFWTGEESIELGLVDELASASEVARDVIGAEDIVDFTKRENVLDQFAKQMGSAMMQSFNSSLNLQ
ncbi:MAG TPA: signal peptide peptidase SppA [Thiotrichaceae bacterium]|jgi:protease-4|nr:signal peptide peptidase SppA [Thiotrichaceae bacterium]HIM08587.1 signal peptide peptidase SppA [Gammaproteobacteria bacterium]